MFIEITILSVCPFLISVKFSLLLEGSIFMFVFLYLLLFFYSFLFYFLYFMLGSVFMLCVFNVFFTFTLFKPLWTPLNKLKLSYVKNRTVHIKIIEVFINVLYPDFTQDIIKSLD